MANITQRVMLAGSVSNLGFRLDRSVLAGSVHVARESLISDTLTAHSSALLQQALDGDGGG